MSKILQLTCYIKEIYKWKQMKQRVADYIADFLFDVVWNRGRLPHSGNP